MLTRKWLVLLLPVALLLLSQPAKAQTQVQAVCTDNGIQFPLGSYEAGGIILTAFDSEALWVYDVERATRYPLPDTTPCTSNCRLSPDARWLTYVNPETGTYTQMRLNGTQRSAIVSGASDVQWWSDDTLLIWTPDHRAYLKSVDAAAGISETLPVQGVTSVQPGGRWGVALQQQDAVPDAAPGTNSGFWRMLVDLTARDDSTRHVRLAKDTAYFNASRWSPDGSALAFVGRGAYDPQASIAGGEIFIIRPGSALPQQVTFLSATYGAVRISGYAPDDLYWSPTGDKLAFWVTELLGPNVEANTGQAVLHVLNMDTRQVTAYCDFATNNHTPNPPRLVWSPQGTHIAFAANIPEDNQGYLLLALNTQSGVYTQLSEGLFPALDQPHVTAWGYRP